jgi:hypothetical protein
MPSKKPDIAPETPEPSLTLDREFLVNLVQQMNQHGCLLVLDGWTLKIAGKAPLELYEIVQRESLGLTWLWLSYLERSPCRICGGGAIETRQGYRLCTEHARESIEDPGLFRLRLQERSLAQSLYRYEFGQEPHNPLTETLYKSRQIQYTLTQEKIAQREAIHG